VVSSSSAGVADVGVVVVVVEVVAAVGVEAEGFAMAATGIEVVVPVEPLTVAMTLKVANFAGFPLVQTENRCLPQQPIQSSTSK